MLESKFNLIIYIIRIYFIPSKDISPRFHKNRMLTFNRETYMRKYYYGFLIDSKIENLTIEAVI